MQDVVVIGAGIAGLLVAHRLVRAGREVTVLEARSRLGGRVLTRDGVDLGASWVWDVERNVHRLLDELGIPTFPHHRAGLDLFESSEVFQRGRLPRSQVAERRVVGGPAAIAEALAHELWGIELGVPARSIQAIEGGLEVRTDRTTIAARHVVAALPPALLATRIEVPGLEHRDLLEQVGTWMADVAKVVALYPRRFWLDAGLSGRVASLRGPMREMHDLSGPDGDPAALFGFVHRPDAAEPLRERVLEQLERLFGSHAADPIGLHIQAWWEQPETAAPEGAGRDPRSMGHPVLREPQLDGRLHLASTETSSIGPGHIEGAVERAERVAATILADLSG